MSKPRTTRQLLDQAKRRHKLPSDNQLAIALGVPRSKIANYRAASGGRAEPVTMADDMTIAVAKLLDEDPSRVLVEIQIERYKRMAKANAKLRPVLSAWLALFKSISKE